MGLSRRAREVVKARAAARRADREAAVQEIDDVRRTMLDRRSAARYLGLAESTLRDLWAKSMGPRGIKFGTSRQARVLYPVESLDLWRLDPSRYDETVREVGPFEPPRRGSPR